MPTFSFTDWPFGQFAVLATLGLLLYSSALTAQTEMVGSIEIMPFFPGCEEFLNRSERRECSNTKIMEDIYTRLSVESNTSTRTAMLAYKQIFYSVTLDTPLDPSDAFAADVSLADVERVTGTEAHPAYVSSVDYGRIVLFRLEATNVDLEVDLEAVMNYAAGGATSIDAELESKYKETLNNSTIQVITIGGNAEAAARVLTDIEAGPGALNPLLGDNAVYTRSNPGVPIAYKVNLLKNHEVVRMGYTTDYSYRRCGLEPYDHAVIEFYNDFDVRDVRVHCCYDHNNPPDGDNGKTEKITITDERSANLPDVPDGAYDVTLVVERRSGTAWREWETRRLKHISASQGEDCWRASDGGLFGGMLW